MLGVKYLCRFLNDFFQDKTCSDIIGRLCVITERRIEFRHLNIVDSPLVNRALNPMRDEFWSTKLKNETKFSFLYLLSALLSRGSAVKDHILSTKEARDKFLYTLLKSYNSDKLVCFLSLKDFLKIFLANA